MSPYSSGKIETLFEHSSDVLLKISETGEILSYKIGSKADFHYDFESLVGSSLTGGDIFRDKQIVAGTLEKVRTSLKPVHAFELINIPDIRRWYELSLFPSEENSFLLVMNDVTERKRTEALFKSIFNNTFQFTGLLNPDGVLIEANKPMLDFAGIELLDVKDELFWETPWVGYDSAARAQLQSGVNRAARGEFVRYEAIFFNKDQRAEIIDFSLKPVFDESGVVIYIIPEGRIITRQKETEEQLQEKIRQLESKEWQYRRLAQNIPNGAVVGFDKDLNYTILEGQLFKNGTLKKEWYRNTTVREFLKNKGIEPMLTYYTAALIGKSSSIEYYSPVINGYLQLSFSPLMNGDEVEGGVLLIVDINKLKTSEQDLKAKANELKMRKEMYRRLASHIPNSAVFAYNHELRYTFVEGHLVEKNQLKNKFLGKTAYEVLPQNIKDIAINNYKKALQGEEITEKVKVEDAVYYTTYLPVYGIDETIEAGMLLIMDITSFSETEERLNETILELKQKNAELEHFAHISSHDLQEPLRMVTLFTQLLNEKYSDSLDDKAREYISFANEGAQRMQQIIYNLLLYTEIDKTFTKPTKVNLETLIKQVQRQLEDKIAEKNAIVNSVSLPEVFAEPSQIKHLLYSLVDNALKFCPPDTTPEVHISAEDRGCHWLFKISDNGIGIDNRHVNRLFNLFQRLHSRNEYPGLGVGLALCQKVISWHKGEIWLESRPGKGTDVYFTLPKKLS